MSGNREYKSDVFSMLMQDKERALQLYNAMNGSSYDNPEDVEMVIHDGGISLSVRNDASFIVDARLSIYEHQSTVCPNMPVRSLIYFSVILSDMLSDKKKGTKSGKNIYGRRLVKIPTPHFVVFYNVTLTRRYKIFIILSWATKLGRRLPPYGEDKSFLPD